MSEPSDIFTCIRCGFCCQGDSTVSLDAEDQARMIASLGLSPQEVEESYWQRNSTCVQMQIVDHHCIFYSKTEGCTVHEGRPWRCRQWPLHPSILSDEGNFQIIRSSCPGIRQDLSWEDFCTLLRKIQEQ